MGRCSGCTGDRCSCVLQPGANVAIVGAGTNANPYIISADGAGGGGSVPTGSIIMFGATAPPAGYLVANGAAVSRSTYANLYGVIGTLYGAGDGSTTFNLPDLAGTFPLGADGTHALASVGGVESYVISASQMPSHLHSMTHTHTMAHAHDITHTHSPTDFTGNHLHLMRYSSAAVTAGGSGTRIVDLGSGGSSAISEVGGTHQHSVPTFAGASGGSSAPNTGGSSAPNTGLTGGATPVDNMPPYLAITFLIKN